MDGYQPACLQRAIKPNHCCRALARAWLAPPVAAAAFFVRFFLSLPTQRSSPPLPQPLPHTLLSPLLSPTTFSLVYAPTTTPTATHTHTERTRLNTLTPPTLHPPPIHLTQVYKAFLYGVHPVAVKVFHTQDDVPTDDFWREISILRTCRHSNIVQFQGACVDGDTTMMVTELLDTDLYRALQVRYHSNRRGGGGAVMVLRCRGTSAATAGRNGTARAGCACALRMPSLLMSQR